jgi:hypothetical protein
MTEASAEIRELIARAERRRVVAAHLRKAFNTSTLSTSEKTRAVSDLLVELRAKSRTKRP